MKLNIRGITQADQQTLLFPTFWSRALLFSTVLENNPIIPTFGMLYYAVI